MEVPKTIFSNDPAEVQRFAAEVGPIVAKMQAKVSVQRQGEQQAVFTSLVTERDLADMGGLKYSP
jgi:hypothetical protein